MSLLHKLERSLLRVDSELSDDENLPSLGTAFCFEHGHESGVITACHCLPRLPNLRNPGDDFDPVRLTDPANKQSANCFVQCCDPVLDIAVLGPDPPGSDAPEDMKEIYESLVARYEPVELDIQREPSDSEFEVHIRTVDNKWETGTTRLVTHSQSHLTVHGVAVPGGTSGAPVFSEDGLAIGLVSRADVNSNTTTVIRIAAALPGKLLLRCRGKW